MIMNVKEKTKLKSLQDELRQVLEANKRLKDAADVSAKRDNDRLLAMERKDETIRLRDLKIAEVQSERDRLVRMVDQFTSISITPLGATVGLSDNGNLPRNLRKT